jgi:hypothetical protein
MSKLRINSSFGVIPNELLNNKTISFKAKGLYAFLQSKPDNWSFSVNGIASQTLEGKDAITGALHELEKAGYLERIKYQNELGQWDCDYILYASLNDRIGLSRDGNTVTENTVMVKPVNIVKNILSKKDKVKNNRNFQKVEKKEENEIPLDPVILNEEIEFEKYKYAQPYMRKVLIRGYKYNPDLIQRILELELLEKQ